MTRRFLTEVRLPIANDPLMRWHRDFSKRNISNRHVGVIGDSIAWGQTLVPGTPPDLVGYQSNMCQQLQRFLNGQVPFGWPNWVDVATSNMAIYDPACVGGYSLRASHCGQLALADPFEILSGTVSYIDRGAGEKSLQLNAGARIAYTAPSATGFYWWYENGASNLGTPTVSIYAGDQATPMTGVRLNNYVQTMNTGLPQYTRSFNASQMHTRGKWTIEFGVSTGTPILDMIYVADNDSGAGVKVYNLAYGAKMSSDFAANNTAANTAAAAAAKMSGYDAYGLDLIVCYLGANDYGNNVVPATFQANLEAIVDKYRAAQTKPCAFLMVSHFARYDVTTPTYPWSAYQAAMQAVTQSRSYVDYLDLAPLFPASQAADTDDDLVDTTGVHLTFMGHSVAAQAIAQKLMYVNQV